MWRSTRRAQTPDVGPVAVGHHTEVVGADAEVEDDTPAQAPGVGLAAVGHHTEVVGVADAEAEDVLVHHVPHRRVHRRTKGTMTCA